MAAETYQQWQSVMLSLLELFWEHLIQWNYFFIIKPASNVSNMAIS